MDKDMVITSLIALFFIYLTYKIDWLFLIGAVIIMLRNQNRILKKRSKSRS